MTGRVVGSGVFRRSKVARLACARTASSESKSLASTAMSKKTSCAETDIRRERLGGLLSFYYREAA